MAEGEQTTQTGAKPAGEGKPSGQAKPSESSRVEGLKVIGGLVAVGIGLTALVLVVVLALIFKPDNTGGSIATSAVGVVGSIIGAYFGVKIGTDGTKEAIKANEGIAEKHTQEATKAQVFALHVPSEKAGEVVEHLLALGGGKLADSVQGAMKDVLGKDKPEPPAPQP